MQVDSGSPDSQEGKKMITYTLGIGIFGAKIEEKLFCVPVEEWRKVC